MADICLFFSVKEIKYTFIPWQAQSHNMGLSTEQERSRISDQEQMPCADAGCMSTEPLLISSVLHE